MDEGVDVRVGEQLAEGFRTRSTAQGDEPVMNEATFTGALLAPTRHAGAYRE